MQHARTPETSQPRWQAQTAFYLSIISTAIGVLSFVYAFYQAGHTERDAKIAATIELARNYFVDRDVTEGRSAAMKWLTEVRTSAGLSDRKDFDAWRKFFAKADYIATLLQADRIDSNFLPRIVICDVWLARITIEKRNPEALKVDARDRYGITAPLNLDKSDCGGGD